MPQIRGSLPELIQKKVDRDVGRYCAERVPPQVRDQVRIEYDIRANSVTIFECRPPWSPELPPEWSRLPVAQLRYGEKGFWTLYWSDRNSRWHVYDNLDPTPDLANILSEIDDDPTAIFWG